MLFPNKLLDLSYIIHRNIRYFERSRTALVFLFSTGQHIGIDMRKSFSHTIIAAMIDALRFSEGFFYDMCANNLFEPL